MNVETKPAYPIDPVSFYLPPKDAADLGKGYSEWYQSGNPYHYIAIDDFLPLEIVQNVYEEALTIGQKPPENSSAQEHLKTSYNPEAC